MKFGMRFMEYLHGEEEGVLQKYSHIEYKRLKKVLKKCRCSQTTVSNSTPQQQDPDDHDQHLLDDNPDRSLFPLCHCQSCPACDQMFFTELMKGASAIALCFSSRVRHVLDLHVSKGMHKYVSWLRQCFRNDNTMLIRESQMLFKYVTMNAIAICKILKKYDKVHSSDNGKNFKSRLRAEHIELLQLPWLIELGAFYLNFNDLEGVQFGKLDGHFSFDEKDDEFFISLMLPDFVNMEYSLTCAVCLETVFNPYALSCSHLFCKSCACSAASVLLFEGLKAATSEAKCPVCREAGVYANTVHMLELDILLKRRCKEQWKERMADERALMVKQVKEYWDLQTRYTIGF